MDDTLYVIAVISNPRRFKSRYKLYQDFEAHMLESPNVKLITVEASFGDRDYEIPVNPRVTHVRLQTTHEIWLKENMINLGIQHLPQDWKYVAWIDADIQFSRRDWARETVQQLQHFGMVQLWSEAVDLGPKFETMAQHRSFVYSYYHAPVGLQLPVAGKSKGPHVCYGGYYGGPTCPPGSKTNWWHPGYAWAMRRDVFDNLGGLVDFAILGAADNHMAWASIGQVERSMAPGLQGPYIDELKRWQDRANVYLRRNIGYVDGTILHYWHGNKKNRRYYDRWKILVENKFDPDNDLKRDWQGLLQLADQFTPRSIKLRDDIRQYFLGRNEDSIDV